MTRQFHHAICALRTISDHDFSHITRKPALCHMRTTKVQISLRIRAVWSAHLLFAAWIVLYLYYIQNFLIAQTEAEQVGFCHTWSQNPDDRFSHDVAHLSSLQSGCCSFLVALCGCYFCKRNMRQKYWLHDGSFNSGWNAIGKLNRYQNRKNLFTADLCV